MLGVGGPDWAAAAVVHHQIAVILHLESVGRRPARQFGGPDGDARGAGLAHQVPKVSRPRRRPHTLRDYRPAAQPGGMAPALCYWCWWPKLRLSRKVRQQLRHCLPFDDKSFPSIRQWIDSERAGEAETGSGGDQPDRGIAVRNSSRRWARARSSRRILGLESGHWRCPARVGFFKPTSD